MSHDNPSERPSGPPNSQGDDFASRWQQVQELLLGDHKRGVQQNFFEVSQRFETEGQRWLSLIEALKDSHVELTRVLGREVQARQELEAELRSLRKDTVSKSQFANHLRSIADELLPGGD